MNGMRVNERILFGNELFARHRERHGLEGGREILVAQDLRSGADDERRNVFRRLQKARAGLGVNGVDEKPVHRIPAVEGIRIIGGEEGELLLREAGIENDRSGEASVERNDGLLLKAAEDKFGRFVRELEHAGAGCGRFVLVRKLHGHFLSAAVEEGHGEGNEEGLLHGLTGRRRRRLTNVKREPVVHLIPVPADGNARRARLRIPVGEFREVASGSFGHRVDEGFARDGMTIVLGDVKVKTLSEGFAAEERLEHADHFRALFVDGARVEVVDVLVAFGADRVRHRARVLHELRRAQNGNVADALHGPGRGFAQHVGREFLIAEDREALLQRELEPVAKRYAVARPVVEVFVADDALNAQVVAVGRDLGVRERAARIEDVEALIFHRAEVEVVRRDDLEVVEVELKPPARLIPADGALEAFKRVFGLVEILRINPDGKIHRAAVLEAELRGARDELAGDERKEVAGLRERVDVGDFAAAVLKHAVFGQIAVREHDGEVLRGAADDGCVAGENVRTVLEECDAAEALGFALAHQIDARSVDARKRGIGPGAEGIHDFELLGALDAGNGEAAAFDFVFAVLQFTAVERNGSERDIFAVQKERRILFRAFGIGPNLKRAFDKRFLGVEVEFEPDGVDEMRRRAIVAAINGLGHVLYAKKAGDNPREGMMEQILRRAGPRLPGKQKARRLSVRIRAFRFQARALKRLLLGGVELEDVAVVVAGGRMAGEAVDILSLGAHVAMDFAEHRTLRIVHAGHVMAAAAGGPVAVHHLSVDGFSHFLAHFNLLFRGAEVTGDFAEERLRAGDGLVDQQSRVVDRTGEVVRFILEVAVRAAGSGAGSRTEVVALLIGNVGGVHRVAEFAAELFSAGPVNNRREHADEHDADSNADNAPESKVPGAIFFHFVNLSLLGDRSAS